MDMKKLLILISTSFLISCGRDGTTETANETDVNFKEFLNAIPNQSLPLELSCGLPDGTKSAEEFKIFKDFIPKSTDKVFGTIKSNNEDYKLIIYGQTGDDIYPIIFSFDNNGITRDSLFLILHGCGGADEYQIPHSFVSISDNLTITLIDTTRLIHFPEVSKSGNNYVVDSLRVSRVVVKVDQSGKFVKQ